MKREIIWGMCLLETLAANEWYLFHEEKKKTKQKALKATTVTRRV